MNRRRLPDAGGCGADEAAMIAGVLRERRLERGLSVAEVARAIRVRERHVAAVEAGRLDALPPPPYGRGLVSAYAELVGVEPERLLQACGRALSAAGDGRKTRIFRLPLRERLTWRDWTVPFALALAFIAIVIVRSALAPEPGELPAPVPGGRSAVGAPPAGDGRAPAGAPPDAGAASEVEPPPEPQAQPEPQPEPVADAGIRVVLLSEGATWAEASIDGGERRRQALGPGQVLELAAQERIGLSIGDAGVVRLRVGDRELGFVGDRGETRTGMSFVAPKAPAPGAGAAAGD